MTSTQELSLVDKDAIIGNNETIKENLFDAVIKPLNPQNTEKFDSPAVNGLYKTSGGECFGTCKGVYEILQPSDFLDTICKALDAEGNGMVSSNNLVYKEFRGGGIISIKAPLRTMEVKTELKSKAGLNDIVDMYVDFSTAFDGRTSTKLSIFTERLICKNGITVAHKQMSQNFKHTKNANLRAKQYATSLVKTLESLEDYQEYINRIAEVDLNQKQRNDLIEEITGYDVIDTQELVKRQFDVESERKKFPNVKIKNAMNLKQFETFNNLMDSLNLEFGRCGNTAYGLMQGMTHFTNHKMKGLTQGEEFIKYDRGGLTNAKTQKVISDYVL